MFSIKRLLFPLISALFLVSCGGGRSRETDQTDVGKKLSDSSEEVRLSGVMACSSFLSLAEANVKELNSLALKDSSPNVRAQALEALFPMAAKDPETLKTYKSSLEDKDLAVAIKAAQKLLLMPECQGFSSLEVAKVFQKAVREAAKTKSAPVADGIRLSTGLASLGSRASECIPVLEGIRSDGSVDSPLKAIVGLTLEGIRGNGPTEKLFQEIETFLAEPISQTP